MSANLLFLLWLVGAVAFLVIAYWYIEVYTVRKHWEQASREVAMQIMLERGRWDAMDGMPPAPPAPPRPPAHLGAQRVKPKPSKRYRRGRT